MTAHRATKDGILKGQNRGEVEDKRAEKMSELEHYRRDNGMGQIRSQVDGFAQVEWQCGACGGKHLGPKTTAGAYSTQKCPACGVEGEHERVYPR